MKKGIGLAVIAALAAAIAASTQHGGPQSDGRGAQSMSCKSTLKIPFVTPLTGGAAFLGLEQLSWAKYAVKTLAPQMGLKIQLLQGDTPVEQGATPGADACPEVRGRRSVVAILGPSTSGAVAASSARRTSRPGWRTSRRRRPGST